MILQAVSQLARSRTSRLTWVPVRHQFVPSLDLDTNLSRVQHVVQPPLSDTGLCTRLRRIQAEH
jgi:hypothetical protein